MPLTGPAIPPLQDMRFTNEALLALFSDDNFMAVGIGQASLGFLSGGPVIRRNGNGRLLSPLGIDRLLQMEGLFAPAAADNTTLYTWTNFDAIGTADDPDHSDVSGRSVLTTMATEVSDIQDFARLVYEGPLNFYEWYYPRRLSLDLRIAAAPFSTQYGLRLLHQDAIAALPKIEFFAQDITGYNHLDVLCAAADRPQRRENEILQPLLDFVLQNSGGTVLVQ
jgi:hypothetical protein